MLEGVQRTFTAKIEGVCHLNYWRRLKALGLMSLQRRRERYIIVHMWKVLHGRCPNDVNVKFSATSRRGHQAVVPSLVKTCSGHNQTLYDSSFAVMGPRLWNLVPVGIRSIESMEQFKSLLTAFVNSFPDEPPVRGYSARNGNSLLEWHYNVAAPLLSGRSAAAMAL